MSYPISSARFFVHRLISYDELYFNPADVRLYRLYALYLFSLKSRSNHRSMYCMHIFRTQDGISVHCLDDLALFIPICDSNVSGSENVANSSDAHMRSTSVDEQPA